MSIPRKFIRLTLVSIVLIIIKITSNYLDQYAVFVEAVQLVIAGFIVIRYGLAFVTNLNHFITLLLFIAAMGFAVVAILSIKQLFTTMKLLNETRLKSNNND